MHNKIRRSSGTKDMAVTLSLTVISLLASIGIQAALAWCLGRDGRGEFAVCVLFAGVMSVVFGCGSDRATQYFLISKRFSVSQAISVALAMVFASSIFAITVGWYLVSTPIAFFNKADPTLFRLGLALIPLTALTTSLQLLLAGLRRFAFAGISSLLTGIFNLAFVLVFVVGRDMGVEGALMSMVLALVLTIAVQFVGLWQDSDRRLSIPGLRDLLDSIGYGLRYYIARLGNVLNIHVGMILLAFIASSREELGLFTAAAVLIGRILIIPTSLNKVLLPRVGEDSSGRPDLVGMSCRMSTLAVGLCLGLLLALSNILVPIMLSPAFQPCVLLLWVLAPGVFFRGGANPMRSYFIGVDRPGVVSLSTGMQLLVNFLLIPVLYHRYGLVGAAWAATAGEVVGSLVLIIRFKMVSQTSYGQTWCWKRSDTAFIKKTIKTILGRKSRTPKQFDNIAEADRYYSKSPRQTILLEDTVVKRQGYHDMASELKKTINGREIGIRNNLYEVPKVLDSSHETGTITFERLDGMVPLLQRLYTSDNSDQLITTIGRSLASIHNELKLPSEMTVPLPAVWAHENSPQVFVHGDFNLVNLLCRPQTDNLIIIDWSVAHFVDSTGPNDAQPTYGTCYFDLAWFITALHFRRGRYLRFKTIRDVGNKADLFLQGYSQQAKHRICMDQFRAYMLNTQREQVKKAYKARGARIPSIRSLQFPRA